MVINSSVIVLKTILDVIIHIFGVKFIGEI